MLETSQCNLVFSLVNNSPSKGNLFLGSAVALAAAYISTNKIGAVVSVLGQ